MTEAANVAVTQACPFCGHALRFSTWDSDGWLSTLACDGCDMRGPLSEYKYDTQPEAEADALRRWRTGNTRLTHTSPDAGALREAVVEESHGDGADDVHRWINTAYGVHPRDVSPRFTRFNMVVAYCAGRQAAALAPEPSADPDAGMLRELAEQANLNHRQALDFLAVAGRPGLANYLRLFADEIDKAIAALAPEPSAAPDPVIATARRLARIMGAEFVLNDEPSAAPVEEVERVAEIINPQPFKQWRSMIDYCLRQGDDEATARLYADGSHRPDCEKARETAARVIAALRTPASAVVDYSVRQRLRDVVFAFTCTNWDAGAKHDLSEEIWAMLSAAPSHPGSEGGEG